MTGLIVLLLIFGFSREGGCVHGVAKALLIMYAIFFVGLILLSLVV